MYYNTRYVLISPPVIVTSILYYPRLFLFLDRRFSLLLRACHNWSNAATVLELLPRFACLCCCACVYAMYASNLPLSPFLLDHSFRRVPSTRQCGRPSDTQRELWDTQIRGRPHRHTSTPTILLDSVGAQGQHRCAPGCVDR